jgi:hypothetical protein
MALTLPRGLHFRTIPSVAPRTSEYLREHTAGSLLRDTFRVYFRNLGTLVVVYTIPTLPFSFLMREALAAGRPGLAGLAFVATLGASFFAYGALAVAVSTVCLGDSPTVRRSYRRVLSRVAAKLAATSALQVLALFASLAALIVPFFFVVVWTLFSSVVVVLEGRWGWAALRRSAALGKGYHWRNAGFLLLLYAVLTAAAFVVGIVIGLVTLAAPGAAGHWSNALYSFVELGLTQPIVLIGTTLLYYDLRVRKESYDVRALAEDLRR